jgi:GT2 family glycosyltransferase
MSRKIHEVPADPVRTGAPAPTLSLILITYNRYGELNRTLSTLKSQDADFELVVVDNGSTSKGTIRLEEFPNAKFLRLDANRGVAGGRNAGIGLATGDILVFLDDDASFARAGTLSGIRERFRREARLGIVASDSRLLPSGEAEKAAIPRRDKRDLSGDYRTSYFCGVSFAVRRSFLKETGGFFESLFLYNEELDLSWRFLDRGYEIVRASDYAVFHRLSPEGRTEDRWVYYNSRNRVWLSFLHLPWRYVASYCLLWWGYLFLRSLRNRRVPSFLSGVRDCLLGLPDLRKRRRVLRRETVETIRRLNGRIPY